MEYLLSMITFTPLATALVLALFLPNTDIPEVAKRAKWGGMLATGGSFFLSLILWSNFDPHQSGFQFVEEGRWLAGLTYKLGIDSLSMVFVLLTTFLMPLVILSCWHVTERVKEYIIAFLILETLMIGVFVSLDLILFYLFFEAGLIPMFLIIGIWGGKERIYAAFKFFLYTLLGSVLMLVAMLAMWADAGTTDIPRLMMHQFGSESFPLLGIEIIGGAQTLMFLAFFASFAVKMPMWPVHTWLPDAHVQAPTAGSVVLAAILLKMGGYGFLRFSLPMFPVGSQLMAPFVLWISAIAIIYASLVALVQEDMKKLIAYSSVAHMGFVTMGIFTFSVQGIEGAIFQMISHGFISSALFLAVGVVYDRMHTREISAYGGLVNRMPAYALIFMFFTMANVGLPGTSGFVGEFLTLVAAFKANVWVGVVATSGVVFAASYALWLYRRVMMGEIIHEGLKSISDMDRREKNIMLPLVIVTLVLGIYPALITDFIHTDVIALLDVFNAEIAQYLSSDSMIMGHGK